MINLTLEDGGALDIPAASILCIEDKVGKGKGCSVIYQLQQGQNLRDDLKDNYGFTKKLWLDSNPQIQNPLEVSVASEPPHKFCIPTEMVVARRELTDKDSKANTRLTVNIGGKVISLDITDRRDSIAGE